MIRMERVEPWGLTQEDIKWLVIGALEGQKWNEESTAQSLVENSILYRISGDAFGVIALSKRKNSLFIDTLAGKGLLRNFSEIHGVLVDIARIVGCDEISGYVGKAGLMKVYSRYTKARPVVTYYVEKLT
jgi:hypothetical protein